MLFAGVPITMAIFGFLTFKIVNKDFIQPYMLPSYVIGTIGQLVPCVTSYFISKAGSCTGFSIFFWQMMLVMMWLAFYHPGNEKITFYGFLLQVINFSLYQVQGTFNYCMQDEIMGDLYKIRDSKWSVILAGLGFYSFGIFWCGNTSDVGIFVLYPYYLDPIMRMLKIVGSWMLCYFGLFFTTVKINLPYDKKINDLINKSSMWAYLSHPFW